LKTAATLGIETNLAKEAATLFKPLFHTTKTPKSRMKSHLKGLDVSDWLLEWLEIEKLLRIKMI
jgi:hypothetical protein